MGSAPSSFVMRSVVGVSTRTVELSVESIRRELTPAIPKKRTSPITR